MKSEREEARAPCPGQEAHQGMARVPDHHLGKLSHDNPSFVKQGFHPKGPPNPASPVSVHFWKFILPGTKGCKITAINLEFGSY
jgi:hypothetical protein